MIKIRKSKYKPEMILKYNNFYKINIGAIVEFHGLVRDFYFQEKESLDYLYLDYYPGMTEKSLVKIEMDARNKWLLDDVLIIHRVGHLKPKDYIVSIFVASKHRDNAFDACRYIIDYLKTEAPFWKKEVSNNHSLWVAQKESDLIKVK